MTMLKLKVERTPAPEEAVNVKVAETDVFGFRTWLALFQVSVRYVLAFEGIQFDIVMLRVSGMLPVFLM